MCLSLLPSGPILPSSLHTVTTLLRPAQKGNFSATLYTHAPTAVMNTHTTQQLVRKSYTSLKKKYHKRYNNTLTPAVSVCFQVTDGSVDLSGCGLHPASIQQLQQPSNLGKTALTHINMNNYSYTWRNWRCHWSVSFNTRWSWRTEIILKTQRSFLVQLPVLRSFYKQILLCCTLLISSLKLW